MPAHADLQARYLGGSTTANAYYDTVLNVTWLANANLAASNTFGLAYGTNYGTYSYGYQSFINSDGTMTWGGAQKWVAAMDSHNYLGYSDWTLPTALNQDGSGPCGGYNCTSSQMGELYYTEGGLTAYQGITQSTTLSKDFSNLQNSVYWSGTVYAPSPVNAWVFTTYDGSQYAYLKYYNTYAMAVRAGDVAAAPVLESDSVMLVALGMGLIGWMARRRG